MSRSTSISVKHQITLPTAVLREVGLKPGDRLNVEALGGVILLVPSLPEEKEEPVRSYGRTKEDVASYIAAERASWKP